MAVSHMTADVKLAVNAIEAVVGTVEVPFTTETGERDGETVPIALHLDHGAFMANIAGLLRAVANEFDRMDPREVVSDG